MSNPKAVGPDSAHLDTYLELPIGATAIGMPPDKRKTGFWRYLKPFITEKRPPCQASCPLDSWIQRFVGATGSGDLEAAISALWLENPFPGVSGRVCYHPCETACNRLDMDGAVSVHAIERYVADHFFNQQLKPPIKREQTGFKVAVCGSGPAGLACAYFLTVLGHEVTVFEAGEQLGGMLRVGIPAYRLPREILDKEIADILSLGVTAQTGCRVGRDITMEALTEKYDAVFLATGAHKSPALGISGETQAGVMGGLAFLADFNAGRAGGLGDRIIVVGGGNTAIDVIRTLIRMGKSPRLLYRRTRQEMPAYDEEIEGALNEGAEFDYLLSPTAIDRHSDDLRLTCDKMAIRGVDAGGRPKPVPLDGESASFEADQIILATGETPDLSYLSGIVQPDGNAIPTDDWGRTDHPKVFAGGDIIDQPWTVTQAIGSAKRAAIAMDRFLIDGQNAVALPPLPKTMREYLGVVSSPTTSEPEVAGLADLNTAYSRPTPAAVQAKLTRDERAGSFKEVAQGLDEPTAHEEAERCMSCGVCKMCG
ncbi:MAG: FAD-dependent oxidoreductase, partial [Deltaproteobacteria bacterium]|nr:FAD-dependent oxidoreductase [Deltaproteobacteria bacterium]